MHWQPRLPLVHWFTGGLPWFTARRYTSHPTWGVSFLTVCTSDVTVQEMCLLLQIILHMGHDQGQRGVWVLQKDLFDKQRHF